MRIHMESLLFEVILNIALLVLVATLLSKVQLIQTISRRSGEAARARCFCRWFLAR